MEPANIRNFVIIAHIDHGKSTLADRFLELTGTVEKRKMREQFLDQMDLEREKGITIKMQPVRMRWRPSAHTEFSIFNFQFSNNSEIQKSKIKNQNDNVKFKNGPPKADTEILPFDFYILNLIDTPGHVDFSYEVSRALAAVEGAVLLVDATQGVQAQTIANLHLARQEGLVVIPAVNKIDLPGARSGECAEELASILDCGAEDVLRVSAKSGEGIRELLQAVIQRVPPPKARCLNVEIFKRDDVPARALIFDSHFDAFRGVVAHVRVFEGEFKRGDAILAMATKASAEAMELGYFSPELKKSEKLMAGEIGYIATGLKDPEVVRVGDTITKFKVKSLKVKGDEAEPLPGYREPKPVVFASVYPENADDYPRLYDALKKVKLNDASLFFEPESSDALGRGFRAGFLGMLHMEITSERLRREHGLDLIFTSPSVAYLISRKNGAEENVYSPSRFPDESGVAEIKEPWVRLEVITPQKFLGGTMQLLGSSRGVFAKQDYLGVGRLAITYEVPLKDVIVDFFDALKSATEGYGSCSYEVIGYRPGDLVRLDVIVAGEREEALAQIVPRDKAHAEGRAAVSKLKDMLPRQLFAVSLQAAVGGRIIARENLAALKKDVTGYLYGGDRTRKMKLWKKQQRGKERLKKTGRVDIPPEIFLKLLRRETR